MISDLFWFPSNLGFFYSNASSFINLIFSFFQVEYAVLEEGVGMQTLEDTFYP